MEEKTPFWILIVVVSSERNPLQVQQLKFKFEIRIIRESSNFMFPVGADIAKIPKQKVVAKTFSTLVVGKSKYFEMCMRRE